MISKKRKDDYDLAVRICAELRKGNKEAIIELFHIHNPFLFCLAKRRLYSTDSNDIDTVINDFWIGLLNGRAICNFKGRASLRTYLATILDRKIKDENRKLIRNREIQNKYIEGNETALKSIDEKSLRKQTIVKEECQKVVHEALLMLATVSPKDAFFIEMHLDGLKYEDMARVELAGKEIDGEKLRKRTDSIKKQFTRSRIGSLAKFKIILERFMKKHEIEYEDFL